MTFDEWYEAQQVPYGHEHYEAMKAAWLAARAIDLRGHLAGRNVRPVSENPIPWHEMTGKQKQAVIAEQNRKARAFRDDV